MLKQWFVPDGLFKPLCVNAFQPVEGQNSCPVCLFPADIDLGNCGTRCPPNSFPAIVNFQMPMFEGNRAGTSCISFFNNKSFRCSYFGVSTGQFRGGCTYVGTTEVAMFHRFPVFNVTDERCEILPFAGATPQQPVTMNIVVYLRQEPVVQFWYGYMTAGSEGVGWRSFTFRSIDNIAPESIGGKGCNGGPYRFPVNKPFAPNVTNTTDGHIRIYGQGDLWW